MSAMLMAVAENTIRKTMFSAPKSLVLYAGTVSRDPTPAFGIGRLLALIS